jgi:hypothetical protein
MAIFNKLYNWIVNKLRFARYAFSPRARMYQFGSFFFGPYTNWKNDPTPLIFCMYSGPNYTHGINIHYLNTTDKMWLGRIIYITTKAKQIMDGYTFYQMLKQQRINIVKTAYRVYFTGMCNYKLVGQGMNTHLYEMVRPHSDTWLRTLNENTSPDEISFPPIELAYSPEELKNRIIQAQNSVPIVQQKITKTGSFGPAPWASGSPFKK